MNRQKHLHDVSSLEGYLESYWLDSTNRIAAGPNGRMRPDEILKTLRRMFELKKETAGNSTLKKMDNITIHGQNKSVCCQFMGRADDRVLLTLVLKPQTKLSKVKIKLYGISDSCSNLQL